MSLPKVTFRSTTTNASAPLTCGHAFKRGDVPAGSTLSGVQCTAITTWPDGSLKLAELAAIGSITGGTPLDIQLTIGAAISGTAVSLADLKSTGITATIDCGTFGSVSWATTDWDSPFQVYGQNAYTSGPVMSTWIYRKPVGSDAHLVAWLRVRCWSNGKVEVLPWIENGYFMVAGPTNKNATYTFTLGGTQRFTMAIDAKHHQRTPLINGTELGYWLGTDPGVSVSHDKAYLQSTELVPSYRTTRSATGLITLPSTWSPFDRGGIRYTDNGYGDDMMTNSGYERPIGLIGEHDAAYLFCNDQPELLYGAVIRNGFAAGRYPIHYRDETTNRAPALLAYQDVTVNNPAVNGLGAGGQSTPAPSGPVTTVWDGAHHFSPGFMAYLLTADFYHLETLQLLNAGNFFTINSYNARAGSNRGRFIPDYGSVQTRQAAWGMRTLAQAASVTPDADTVQRNAQVAVLNTLIDYYHGTFVAQANNPFGIIEPGESYKGIKSGYNGGLPYSAFQDSFFVQAWGYALALGLPIDSTRSAKLAAFFAWKAKSTVNLCGPSDQWPVKHCDIYVIVVSPTEELPDFQGGTGPWFNTVAEMHAASVAFETTRDQPQTWLTDVADGQISGEYDSTVWPRAMLGNLMPALALAQRFAVPGADAAATRLKSASNWSAIQSNFVTYAPLWDQVPSGATSIPGGGTLTTPGPSFIWDSAPLVANSFIWDAYRGLGIPLSAVPSGGTNGTSVIRALIESGDNPNSEARVRYISTPSGFASAGDTSYTSPAGAINYEAYLDGASLGQATDTVGTGGGSDTTAPTMNGAISSSAITASSFTLSWPAASDNVAVTGYEVSIDAGSTYIDVGNALTANKSALTASTSYPVRVRAYDAANNKATPLSATVNTAASSDSTAPNMQGSLAVSLVTEAGFTVAWLPASDNVAVTGYEFSTDNGSTYANIGSVLIYAKTGLSASTLYNVKVRAYDGAGNRSTPLSATATTLAPGTVPSDAVQNYGRKNIKPSKFKITRFR
jgi:chitodextrinase